MSERRPGVRGLEGVAGACASMPSLSSAQLTADRSEFSRVGGGQLAQQVRSRQAAQVRVALEQPARVGGAPGGCITRAARQPVLEAARLAGRDRGRA